MYNKTPKIHVRKIYNSVAVCFLLASSILVLPAVSMSAVDTSEPNLLGENVNANRFEYVLENRADPFVPFLSEKAATASVDMNEVIESKEPLTGMQLFEPGQLTLVALMQKGGEDIAMVEDFTGKGYVLTEGIKIGRRGVVKDIALNRVLIEETAETRAGKKIITEIVMILKKEGEE
ncbi:pilus assembly protein PilP [Desulforhopalus sp. IMCC35007]|uniref:pilus assembly protein PilP n=1 Tax=Desulforhopalus sp. IMCC35007 TaxID=2569543 RepID=UPI00145E5C14|nr:pilus assembly protein PilP [Desulforhopalus sp. IMCC35007]